MSFWRRLLTKIFPARSAKAEATESHDHRYQVGQVWTYRTRAQDEESRILIGRIERVPRRPKRPGSEDELETVISVLVSGLEIDGSGESAERLTEISHLPVDRLALDASVVALVGEKRPIPESFDEGYEQWKLLFARGAAAYYKFPVAQCVELAERAFRSSHRPLGV